MERKRVLIAVKTNRDIQDLRNALATAGYEVRIVNDGSAASNLSREFRPHLVLSEIELPKIDGHHLLQELKSQSATKNIPFVLMSHHRSVEERVHSINLGADEYITTPFDVKEVIARFEIILKEIDTFEPNAKSQFKGFWGKLSDMNLVELLQTLEIGKKSGIIKIQNEEQVEGLVLLHQGEVFDASLQNLDAERALFRMFSWDAGSFKVELRPIDQAKTLKALTNDLIRQGLVYRDRWQQIAKHLPPLHVRAKPDPGFSSELHDYEVALMEQFKNSARLDEVIENSSFDDLKALSLIAGMFRQGCLLAIDPDDDLNGQRLAEINGKNYESQESQVSRLFASFFGPKPQSTGTTVERRHEERRQVERRMLDRRRQDRRWSDLVVEKPSSYLSKSELTMIREKLSNGQRTRRRTETPW